MPHVSYVCFFSSFFFTQLVVISTTTFCVLVHNTFTRKRCEPLTETEAFRNLAATTVRRRPLLR